MTPLADLQLRLLPFSVPLLKVSRTRWAGINHGLRSIPLLSNA